METKHAPFACRAHIRFGRTSHQCGMLPGSNPAASLDAVGWRRANIDLSERSELHLCKTRPNESEPDLASTPCIFSSVTRLASHNCSPLRHPIEKPHPPPELWRLQGDVRGPFAAPLQCWIKRSGPLQRLSCAVLRRYGLSRAVRGTEGLRCAGASKNGPEPRGQRPHSDGRQHYRHLSAVRLASAVTWCSLRSADSPKRWRTPIEKRPILAARCIVP